MWYLYRKRNKRGNNPFRVSKINVFICDNSVEDLELIQVCYDAIRFAVIFRIIELFLAGLTVTSFEYRAREKNHV